jgi:DNA-binding NtrC family response regulator
LPMQKSILLVEDDEPVRRMVGRVLESAGYAVTQVGTSAEAAVGLRTAPPDLVVWDLEMASPGGTEELGCQGQSEHSVPVIGITAWPNQAEKAACKGISALMEKPLDIGLLLNTIHDLLVACEQGSTGPLTAVS